MIAATLVKPTSVLGVANFDVAPIDRVTVHDRVYSDLRARLMRGQFAPGQPMTIAELSAAFGTSAQSVRDATRQLCAERALEALPNRTTRVPVLDRERLEDLRRARRAVEGLAAERLIDIDDQETQADDANRVEISVRHNHDFHFSLYHLSGSTVLPPMIESLWLQLGPYIRQSAEFFDASQGRGVEFHRLALDALRAHDPPAVRRAIEQDINRLFDLVTSDSFFPRMRLWKAAA